MTHAGPPSAESPTQSLEIRVHGEPPDDWDGFVVEAEGGSFCHLGGWGEVFRRSLGLTPRYLVARDEGGLRGVLPLYRMPRLGPGKVLVSVPYLNYGGPLGDGMARTALLERAVQEAQESGARRLEVRARSPVESELPKGREKVTVVLPLPDDPEVLFKDTFKSKLRSQVRRPMKAGMEARFGPQEEDHFYRVFARNMRDLGTPVLPRSFFREMARAFPHRVDFGAVYLEEEPVAAGCGFHFGDEFEMTWASSLREFNRQAPNMLLYWAFMERCIEAGRKAFNFGRCTPGGGTHRFKSQWGGEDEPLAWIQWPEEAEAASPESGVFQTATRLWQRLPLPVANRLGPFLARRIPTF